MAVVAGGVSAREIPETENLRDFDLERFHQAGDSLAGDHFEFVGRDGFFVVVSGKQQLQQPLADIGDRPLRGEISAIDSSKVAWQNLPNKLALT